MRVGPCAGSGSSLASWIRRESVHPRATPSRSPNVARASSHAETRLAVPPMSFQARVFVPTEKVPSSPDHSVSRNLSVGTADHHQVPVEVAQPHLTVARRSVHVNVFDHLGVHGAGPGDGRVQIVDLELHENPMAVPPARGIDEDSDDPPCPRHGAGAPARHPRAVNRRVIVVRGHQLAGAGRPEQRRVPPGARPNITHGEERLRANGRPHGVKRTLR